MWMIINDPSDKWITCNKIMTPVVTTVDCQVKFCTIFFFNLYQLKWRSILSRNEIFYIRKRWARNIASSRILSTDEIKNRKLRHWRHTARSLSLWLKGQGQIFNMDMRCANAYTTAYQIWLTYHLRFTIN